MTGVPAIEWIVVLLAMLGTLGVVLYVLGEYLRGDR